MFDEQHNEQQPPFTREQVVQAFLQSLNQLAGQYLESAEASFQTSAEMDGKMQSRYDTQKEEYAAEGNMKLSTAQRISDSIKDYLENTNSEGLESAESIDINSVFQLEDLVYGGKEWFFLLTMAGGHSVTVNGEKVTGLNPESHLGAYAHGQRVGTVIKYDVYGEVQKFRILNVI